MDIAHSVVQLEVLAENGETVSWATGFIVEEDDFTSLYTCWHVVSGVSPCRLPVWPPQKREKIRVHSAKKRENPVGFSIGGHQSFEVDLYDSLGRPLWHCSQGRPSVDMPLDVPMVDIVRIDVSLWSKTLPEVICCDLIDESIHPSVFMDLYLVGYPYGFSASVHGPSPVFLKRSVASLWSHTHGSALLDGSGAKSMSGGPVLLERSGKVQVIGIYSGELHPEAAKEDTYSSDEWGSRLPIGVVQLLGFVRPYCTKEG